MKRIALILTLAATVAGANAQWKPVGGKILTPWAEKVDPKAPLPEYPRPAMKRGEWKNLNGEWNYAILPKGQKAPESWQGKILVPYAVESALSGVGKRVSDNEELWYERSFTVPKTWDGRRTLLHFGAVDWLADVWVNGVKVGSHSGGYTPFSFDVTDALQKGDNTVTLRVWDPTNRGYQPRGKQTQKPTGIWYTPVTGIWQTVWLEPVGENHIASLNITPDIDAGELSVGADLAGDGHMKLEVDVYDGARKVASGAAVNGEKANVAMPADMKLWSPDSPNLYGLKVRLVKDGKVVDQVDSYTAMRKISTGRDENGVVRMELNNKPLFQMGPLDQGWWPDGLYTAPTDEALAYDIKKTKDLGFNMIRKHVKVEPARWYTHCDSLGILVWQDMPSGDRGPQWIDDKYFDGTEFARSEESEAQYRKEWKEIMDFCYNNPSVVVWVPFNEAWGQFKTPEIVAWTKKYDPSRLVNPASGGNHYPVGDMLDLHHYPEPKLYLYDAMRPTVLGEYGGIGLVVKDHIWEPDKNWGYVKFNSPKEVTDTYVDYAGKLLDLVPNGFSAGVYTQTTDVEGEVNGLMTYDRKVLKVDEKAVREANQKLVHSLDGK